MTMVKPDPRFWAKVDFTGPCWVWTGYTNADGYGKLCRGTTTYAAHRVAYFGMVGEIPNGLELDHLCRNRACVNPDHLEPVTHHVNVMRGSGLAAKHARRTSCSEGHELTPENTYIPPRGDGRYCRTCRADRRHHKTAALPRTRSVRSSPLTANQEEVNSID